MIDPLTKVLFDEANFAASLSPDPSTQTGAVLHDRTMVIGRGHNGFPDGVDEKHWAGPKECKYARVVHAEVAAILNAVRTGHGNFVYGSRMYAPWAACSNCAKHIAYAGVSRLYRLNFLANGVDESSPWYEDCLVGDEILGEAGVEIIEIDDYVSPVRLRRNGALWP